MYVIVNLKQMDDMVTSFKLICIVGDLIASAVKLLIFSSCESLVNLNPLKFDEFSIVKGLVVMYFWLTRF